MNKIIRHGRVLASGLAALAFGAIAAPASANNRAFTAIDAAAENQADQACLFPRNGASSITNNCTHAFWVDFPWSVDAGAWYTPSVYGNGAFSCQSGVTSYNGVWTLSATVNLAAGVTRVQLPAQPVNAPGDTVYVTCWMNPKSTILSTGWN